MTDSEKILTVLAAHRAGATTAELAQIVGLHRDPVGKLLARLWSSGHIDKSLHRMPRGRPPFRCIWRPRYA